MEYVNIDDPISFMSMLPLLAVSFLIMMLIHSYVRYKKVEKS